MPENLSLLTLPSDAPELTPVENVWQYLQSKKLAALFSMVTTPSVIDACCTAWDRFAKDPETVTSITSRSWGEVNV